MDTIDFMKGITFAPFHKKDSLSTETARKSFAHMVEQTAADFVVFAPAGIQKTAHSEEICYTSEDTFSDEELILMIRYAKEKGIRVGLKPTVNCKDGTWRAYISFFEHDVPCEPKWENWFASYTEFQTHYAKIAEEEQCDIFIAGCEMVMTEHREKQWREVIASIRKEYHGLVSYNTDKYQKPFFFAEAGCMSKKGSGMIPNNWELQGELRLEEQCEWYRAMFEACKKRPWLRGFALWEWAPKLPSASEAWKDDSYEICEKPVQEIIKRFYEHETGISLI